ncbi:MAG: hypothetical protein R2797_10185 [Gelidibacter sp.]
MKTLAFIMLFLFSMGSMLAQSADRTTFFNRCIDDVPVGPSEADIANLYLQECQGNSISVVKSSSLTGDNCDWEVIYTYEIKCLDFEDEIKIIYVGGDRTAPVIDQLPEASKIECPDTPEFEQATATDNCGGNVTLTYSDSTTPGNCAGNYTVTRTWTATDECNNSSTATQVIEVEDNTDPVISDLPEPTKIECPAVPEFTTPTATDTCDAQVELTYSDSTTPGDCAGNYTVTRTWTATDDCGNTATASQVIEVEDNTDPVISDLPEPTKIECPAVPEFTTPTATDTCDTQVELTYSDSTTPGDCAGNYTVTRTWTATDDCGNTATATQIIEVEDNTDPTIAELPSETTIDCPASPSFTQAVATDNCDDNVRLTYRDVTTFGNCSGNYSVTRTWTATDDCGNTATATQTINVHDVTPPVIQPLPEASTIDCPAVPQFQQAVASDECDPKVNLTYRDVTNPTKCAGRYSVTRTWTATDECGNTSTASQTINVQDITPPVISELPAETTIDCPATPQFAEASATDGCDPKVNLTWRDVTTPGNCDGNYSVTRTWTAIDECGNISTASQTINVQDITPPVISALPEPSKVECPNQPDFATPIATDTCDRRPTLTYIDTYDLDECGLGTVTRTWTATDACQNTATASQTITIEDNLAPEISGVGEGYTVECPNQPEFSEPSASDACDQQVSLSYVDTPDLDECGLGTVTRTWTATDCAGNSSTASQTITIEDNTAPEISGVGEDDKVECPNQPEFSNPSASDACDQQVSLSYVDTPDLDECGLGTVTRTWTATDCAGNSSTASQTITIEDNTNPYFNEELPQDMTVECDSVPEPAVLTATDACSEASVDYNQVRTDGDCPNNYTLTRTWTASDCAGNTIEHVQVITVQDTTPPVLIGTLPQGESNINACFDDMPEGPSADDIAALFADACGVVEVIKTANPLGDNCDWAVLYRYTVKDDCGNYADPVKVYYNGGDNTPPSLVEGASLPEGELGMEVCYDNLPEGPSVADIEVLFEDNCGRVVVEALPADISGNNCAWEAIYEFTVEDDCGNKAPNVIVRYTGGDNTAPVRVGVIPMGQNSLDLCIDSPLGEPSTDDIAALYTDNCGAVVVTKIEKVYGTTCNWIRVFEYTVKDECGNGDEIVKVNYQGGDQSAPYQTNCFKQTTTLYTDMGATCPADATISLEVGDEINVNTDWSVAGLSLSQLGASMSTCFADNCTAAEDLVYEVTDKSVGGGDCSNILTVTFNVSDSCGNTYEGFVYTFIIMDNEAPTVNCPADEDFGLNPALNNDGTPEGVSDKAAWTDNCQGSGETDNYTDVLTEETYYGVPTVFNISCIFEDGAVGIVTFNQNGTDEDGYAVYDLGYRNDTNLYYYTMLYDEVQARWEVDEYNADTSLRGTAWYFNTTDLLPSCNPSDWNIDSSNCTEIYVDCGYYTGNYVEKTLVRTFTQNDGCGNVGECSVTYTWVEGDQVNLARSLNRDNAGTGLPIVSLVGETSKAGNDVKLDFTAYPVPFDKEVSIKYNFEFNTDVSIDVHDTKGLLILSEVNNNYRKNTDYVTKLDLSRGGDQVFYVTVTTNQGKVTKKIVSSGLKRH